MADLKELFLKLEDGSMTEDCTEINCENGYCGKDVNSLVEKCFCHENFVGINCEQKDVWIASIDHDKFDNISGRYAFLTGFLLFLVGVLVAMGYRKYFN